MSIPFIYMITNNDSILLSLFASIEL